MIADRVSGEEIQFILAVGAVVLTVVGAPLVSIAINVGKFLQRVENIDKTLAKHLKDHEEGVFAKRSPRHRNIRLQG